MFKFARFHVEKKIGPKVDLWRKITNNRSGRTEIFVFGEEEKGGKYLEKENILLWRRIKMEKEIHLIACHLFAVIWLFCKLEQTSFNEMLFAN